MEAKNFRIGNLVHKMELNINTGKYEFPIVPIDYHILFDLSNKNKITIEPIVINEEWLHKLGFTRDDETDYRWYLLDKSIAYDADDNCIRIADSWEFGKRKYVHELQNLFFSLTGTELELKDECSTCG